MPGRILWQTSPPTSVDERLTVYDDGTADLLVLAPRTIGSQIGWYRTAVSGPDRQLLAGAGEVHLDVRELPAPDIAAVAAAAERVAVLAAQEPVAVVWFAAVATPGPVLLAVAGGRELLGFELDVPGSAVIFEDAAGQALAWCPLPELATGFMSPDAQGLGGVRRLAEVPPGKFGAIDIPLPVPDGAVALRIDVTGQLLDAPGESTPVAFHVCTPSAQMRRDEPEA